jgi:hypothetical protein
VAAYAAVGRDAGRYEADPELAALRLDFTATLGEMLEVMSAGLLTRGGPDDR